MDEIQMSAMRECSGPWRSWARRLALGAVVAVLLLAAGTTQGAGGPPPSAGPAGARGQVPAAGALYYTDDGGALFRLDLHTGETLPIISMRVAVYLFSPDGTRIAFEDTVSGALVDNRGLYVVGALGGSPRRLARLPGGGGLGGFQWSPDGTRIAYTENTGRFERVSVVAVHGGRPRRLARSRYLASEIRWSADGEAVYYREAWGGPRLVRVDPETAGAQCVEELPPLAADQAPLLDCMRLYDRDESAKFGLVQARGREGTLVHRTDPDDPSTERVLYRQPWPRHDEWFCFVPWNVGWLASGPWVVYSAPASRIPVVRAFAGMAVRLQNVDTGAVRSVRGARNPGWYDPDRRGEVLDGFHGFAYRR